LTKNILNPDINDAYSFIKKYHLKKPDKTTLIIAGSCNVDYRGRARSFLDWGERIIMIKQDNTVLVHRPEMREPVNWQPTGSNTEFLIKKDNLILKSNHRKPPEKMTISFRKIKFITISKLKDKAKLELSGMELDVVNNIMQNPCVVEEGLRIAKREKKVNSGMIDIFAYDKDHTPVVIEVKRSIANILAVQQLRMYVKDIKKDVKSANVRGVLCAPKVPDMVKNLLTDYNLEWKEVERKVILPDDNQQTLKKYIKQ